MSDKVNRVGFIGLGDIGLAMAGRIVSGGFQTTVCGHRRREPVEEMLKLGAKEVKTPKEVAANPDVTIIQVQTETSRPRRSSSALTASWKA